MKKNWKIQRATGRRKNQDMGDLFSMKPVNKIDGWYSLEPPLEPVQEAVLSSTHNLYFCAKRRKKSQFFI